MPFLDNIKQKITLERSVFVALTILMLLFCIADKSFHRTIFYVSLIPFIGAVVHLVKQKQLLKSGLLIKILGIYCVYTLISVIWAIDFDAERALRTVKGMVFALCFTGGAAFITYRYHKAPQKLFTWLMGAFALSAFIAVILSAISYLNAGDINARFEMIERGKNANIAGFFCAFAIIVLCYVRSHLSAQFSDKKLGVNVVFVIMLCTFVVALALTQSRSAMLALLVVFGLYLLLHHKWKIIVSLSALAATLGFVFKESLLSLNMAQRGLTYREEIWSYAIYKITQAPIIGHGAGGEFALRHHTIDMIIGAAHNVYLGALYDGGLIGFALFAGVYALTFKAAFSLRNISFLPFALLSFGAVVGLFEFHTYFLNLNQEWLIFWLPIGMILGLTLAQKKA